MRHFLLGFALLILSVRPAFACECRADAFTPEASRANIEAAAYIFAGRVLSLDKNKAQPAPPEAGAVLPLNENPNFSRLRVRIEKMYKGPAKGKKILTLYADIGTSCGAPPEEMENTNLFIVYAQKGGYSLADYCGYFLTDADMAALLRGEFTKMKISAPPVEPLPAPPETESPDSPKPQPQDKAATPPATPVEEVKAEKLAANEAPKDALEPKQSEPEPEPEMQPQPQKETKLDPAPEAEPEGEAPPPAAVPGLSFSLHKNGASLDVPAPLQAELAAGFDKTLRNCWLFQGERTPEDWETAMKEGPYIALHYDTAVETVDLSGMPGQAFGAKLLIEEAIFPARPGGQVIEAPLIRSNDQIFALTKCDGTFLLTVQCRPQLAAFFEDSYKNSCHIVEKWKLKK